MSRRFNRITGIQGVTQGGNATVSLPGGRRYHGITLYTRVDGTLTACADVIRNVRIIVGGRTIRDLSAALILKIAKLNGITPATGELPIFFSEPWRRSVMGEESVSWDMGGINSFQIEVSLKSPGGTIGLSGTSIIDFIRNRNQEGELGNFIVHQNVIAFNPPAGQSDFDTLPIRHPIQRLLLDSNAQINSVDVTVDGSNVYEVTKTENTRELTKNGFDPSQFAFPVVFDHTQQITDSLEVGRTLNLRADMNSSAALGILVEATKPGFI